MMNNHELWKGLLSLIVKTMAERNAKEAVLYVMGRDQVAELKPFGPEDKEALAEYLGNNFDIDSFVKYVGVVLLLRSEGGRRFSEFYPITPARPWPDYVAKEVIRWAIAAAGYGETTFEGGLISLDGRAEH